MGSFGEVALIRPTIIFKESTELCVDFAEILLDAKRSCKDLFVWFG